METSSPASNAPELPAARADQAGVTLIELMVVLLIMLTLAVIGARLGTFWNQSAQLTQSQAVLQHAFSFTKSAALQNALAQPASDAAATLCFSGTQLSVHRGEGCGGAVIWTGALATGASLSMGAPGAVPVCVALSSAGQPQPGSQACTTSLNYSLSLGAASVSDKTPY